MHYLYKSKNWFFLDYDKMLKSVGGYHSQFTDKIYSEGAFTGTFFTIPFSLNGLYIFKAFLRPLRSTFVHTGLILAS